MIKKIIFIFVLGLMLSACGSLIKVHRLDVQQGNVLSDRSFLLLEPSQAFQSLV